MKTFLITDRLRDHDPVEVEERNKWEAICHAFDLFPSLDPTKCDIEVRERVVTVFSADSLKTPFFKVEEKR
jgi:hypothetical protein